MTELFVPYQEALDMKLLEFNEPCFGLYNQIKELCYPQLNYGEWKSFHDQKDPWITPAPTYSQAFRWFREKHGLQHTITWNKFYLKTPQEWNVRKQWTDEPLIPYGYSGMSSTYEQAELACLRKLIELVKQQL